MVDLLTNTPRHLDWNRLRISLDWAIDYHQRERYRLAGEAHWYSVFWVRQGTLKIRAGGEVDEISSGEWAFLIPGKRTLEIPVGTHFYTVAFHVSWSGEGELVHAKTRVLCKTESLPALEEKTMVLCRQMYTEEGQGELWSRLQNSKQGGREHFYLRFLFHDWLRSWVEEMEKLGMGWRHIHRVDKRMVDTTSYLENLAWDAPIDSALLAQRMGVSVRQFFRIFNNQFGTTPKAWRDQFLLKEAIRQLQSTDLPIQRIAESFGLSPSHFGVWIRKKTGKTSQQVRREVGK